MAGAARSSTAAPGCGSVPQPPRSTGCRALELPSRFQALPLRHDAVRARLSVVVQPVPAVPVLSVTPQRTPSPNGPGPRPQHPLHGYCSPENTAYAQASATTRVGARRSPGSAPITGNAITPSRPRRAAGRRAVIAEPSCVGSATSLGCVHDVGEEWPPHRETVPVAPRGPRALIFQDRNMPLTW